MPAVTLRCSEAAAIEGSIRQAAFPGDILLPDAALGRPVELGIALQNRSPPNELASRRVLKYRSYLVGGGGRSEVMSRRGARSGRPQPKLRAVDRDGPASPAGDLCSRPAKSRRKSVIA
jgi:hypothetical protein